MRIALFSSTAEPKDGYGNITWELVHALKQCSVDCTLFLPRSQKTFVAQASLPCETCCVLPEYVFRIYQPEGLKYFRSVDVSDCDLVHDLFAFPYCVPALLSARQYDKPFMTGAQGTHGVRPLTYFPERWLLKHCYKRAQAIAVPSVYTKEKILELAKCSYSIDIIHNGVNFERFQKQVDTEAIRNRYHEKKILLTVGGLWGRKGHDLVLKSLPQILQKHPDTVYVIVGDGNGRPDLEAMTKELGIQDSVDFVGRKSGDELVAYSQSADIYVHTPKVVGLKFEGFGIVYLEASACGKPIVATDAGGIRDAVRDGETGIVVPDGDINAVAGAVIRLLDHPEQAGVMGQSGKRYAALHDWRNIAKQYISLYDRILHAR
jgi:glycosyltransferase involved in cell wall biosynthesis